MKICAIKIKYQENKRTEKRMVCYNRKNKEMEKTMRPEYIFMDLDGTISDPKEGITKAVAHALSYYGIQVENLDTLEKFIGPPLLDSFQNFYGFFRGTEPGGSRKIQGIFQQAGSF